MDTFDIRAVSEQTNNGLSSFQDPPSSLFKHSSRGAQKKTNQPSVNKLMNEQISVRGTHQYCENLNGTNYKKGYGHTVSPMDDQMTKKQIKLMDIRTDQTGSSWYLSKYAQGRMNKQNRYNINRIVKKKSVYS